MTTPHRSALEAVAEAARAFIKLHPSRYGTVANDRSFSMLKKKITALKKLGPDDTDGGAKAERERIVKRLREMFKPSYAAALATQLGIADALDAGDPHGSAP